MGLCEPSSQSGRRRQGYSVGCGSVTAKNHRQAVLMR